MPAPASRSFRTRAAFTLVELVFVLVIGALVAVTATGIASARALECVSVHADQRRLDAATIERLHDAGFAVLAYTVNDRRRAQALIDAGADALLADRLDLIRPD